MGSSAVRRVGSGSLSRRVPACERCVKGDRVSVHVARGVVCALMVASLGLEARAATITVNAGGNLQAAINAAQPGDVIQLQAGATFTGNFVLPDKGATTGFITIRSATDDLFLPAVGARMDPVFAPYLATIRSPNSMSAVATAPGAHHWQLELLRFAANASGYGEIIALGSGGPDQNTLDVVPHHLVLDRLLVQGDPVIGQKRGIALNSASTTISNSYIADCKGNGFDAQAIGGWNGPGPYLITNNYLEGSGENFMIGGSSPKIPNLVPANLTFTRNYLAKPLSWQAPILATPTSVTAVAAGAGTLPAGSYSYFVVAARPTAQDSWVWSGRSTVATVTLPASGGATISWAGDPKATVYRVYRGPAGGPAERFFDCYDTTFTDTGALTPKGYDDGAWIAPSRWSVKNLFELKEMDHALVDGNVFEQVWQESQSGYAILFTPRNQDNTSPWISVRDVTFSNNIVRHAGAGIQVLGYDDVASTSSQHTQGIRIVNNLFTDVGFGTFAGAGRFLLVAHGPTDVTVDHNTVLQRSEYVYAYGGSVGAEERATNFTFTNNLVKHTDYGVIGDGHGPGKDSINAYLTPGVFSSNGIGCVSGASGCSAGNYPPGNQLLGETDWQAQFVDYAGGNYRVAGSSVFVGAGTDGKTLGADVDAIVGAIGNATSRPPAAPKGLVAK